MMAGIKLDRDKSSVDDLEDDEDLPFSLILFVVDGLLSSLSTARFLRRCSSSLTPLAALLRMAMMILDSPQ